MRGRKDIKKGKEVEEEGSLSRSENRDWKEEYIKFKGRQGRRNKDEKERGRG